ncbi:Signal peptidase complex catalytic subunit [Venturia inaequalis]|uniref:Signal peptidase complex catalytic subunit SEC11 n=1 Tax=Venturia inaequalis TaxID=5025 RepID=A0A8H3Z0X7_VENIN|nr:Signal peptidase complex catalytic subunit [Venturia inaequalis]
MLGNMQPRQLAAQVLNFALVLSTAFMLWKGLSVVSNSPSPIVVVLSGSMEPAFERGDLLFLWNRGMDTQIGEVVVYNVRGKDIPIVHRVVRRFGGGETPLQLLTKGDNNAADDTELYAQGQNYLTRETDVIGSVIGYVPMVGYVTILLSEYPWLKTAMLGIMGLTMLAVEVGRLPDTLWCTVKEEAALWLCHFVFMNLMPAIEWLWEVPWFDREKSATA